MQQYFTVLKTKYDQSTFQKFAHELLNDIQVNRNQLPVDPPFKDHIDSLVYLGSYTDSQNKNLHILDVTLKTQTKLEQARTMQRNLIARYLKDHWLDGALVAFHTESSSSWRLSFVKVEYKYDESGKPKEELTPAKRYSFIVGEGEPSHTAQTQLSKLYEQTSVNPTLAQLEEAFGVEKVTKEFFEKYRGLFESVLAELKSNHTFQNEAVNNNIDTESFAKKLLGQIVFLYFLQKKGWLGVPKGKAWGEGDKHFLRGLFKKSEENHKNFYNDYLEKLFYDTLNNPRRSEVDPSYSKYFDSKIPFLNGGLFEPPYDWNKSLIYLDNKIFSKIFDVFDLYNFTVKEDEPLEKEVAVDPEMLGKVFENLLEENLRKGKGTYYTPREIVHYMCEESLINYLSSETGLSPDDIRNKYFPPYNILGDEKVEVRDVTVGESIIENLKNIKVVDPACGSGAFLVGMLQQITQLRFELETRSKLLGRRVSSSTEYEIKKQTIQNCIYGVDLDPGAVEIAKLRLWLSLVVDYDLEEIEPLPNLDYKIMQGNSLLEELVLGDSSIKLYDSKTIQKAMGSKRMKNLFDQETQVGLFDGEDDKVLKILKSLQLKYFSTSDGESKKKIRNEIEKIEHELIETSVKSSLDELKAQKLNIRTIPGIGLLPDDLKRLEKIASKENKIFAVLEELKKTGTKPFFLWHLYFAEVFELKGGFDVVIANPPYGADIEKKQLEYMKKRLIDTRNGNSAAIFIDFGKNVLLNNKGTLSYIVPKSLLFSELWFDLVKAMLGKVSILVDVEKAFEKVLLEQVLFIYGNSIKTDSYLARKFINNDFIRTIRIKNEDVFKFNAWICDVTEKELEIAKKLLSKSQIEMLRNISITKRGVGLQKFIKNSGDFPVIGGKNIFKYGLNGNKGYLHNDVIKNNSSKISFMNQMKIISQNIVAHIQNPMPHLMIIATLDTSGKVFTLDTVNNTIISKDIDPRYILAIMNSSLISWYAYRFVYCAAIRTMHFDSNYVGKLPIFNADKGTQQIISEKVESILRINNSENYKVDQNLKAQVNKIQHEIDQLIYQIYGLDSTEIKTINFKNYD